MDEYMVKEGKQLRLGYTTGTCAAAAAKAAAMMLLSAEPVEEVKITTPSGVALCLELVDVTWTADFVTCAIVKDGGDDPDVTHGLKIFATVTKQEAGIRVEGGPGVGVVTLPGLSVAVGEAAINPVPLRMITSALTEMKEAYRFNGGLRACIFVPGGEEIAKKTFNPRLGILGGISILGTTGIVRPMSDDAIIETIHLEMRMRRERGDNTVVVAPGNYGVDYVENELGFSMGESVTCSNYIGEALDYAAYLGFKRLLLVGHVGKLVKLAAGIMNTHSKIADGRMEILAAHAGMAGAGREQVKKIMTCATTDATFALLDQWGFTQDVLESLREKIQFHLDNRVGYKMKVLFILFSGQGRLIESCRDEIKAVSTLFQKEGA